jgi:hypothetical protein
MNRYRIKDIGSTVSGKKSEDDAVTLKSSKFQIGDFMDIAIKVNLFFNIAHIILYHIIYMAKVRSGNEIYNYNLTSHIKLYLSHYRGKFDKRSKFSLKFQE